MLNLQSPFSGFRQFAQGRKYLLDHFKSSKPAWALARLRAGYSGPCIRVRRVSDSVEADIGFGADGYLDTDALASHCGESDGRITIAYDQSVNDPAINHTQGTLENQPKIYDGSTGLMTNEYGRPAWESTETRPRERLEYDWGFAAGVNLSLAMVVTKSAADTAGALVSNGPQLAANWARFAGAYQNGVTTAPGVSAGADIVHLVDGVALDPQDRTTLYTALGGATRTTKVFQLRTFRPHTWAKIIMLGYDSTADTLFGTDCFCSAGVYWADTDLTDAEFNTASLALRDLFTA